MSRTRALRLMPLLILAVAVSSWAQDLAPGNIVPDCSKIPLVPITQPSWAGEEPAPPFEELGPYQPPAADTPSLENLLLTDGVVIVHFCSPRAPRHSAFQSFFTAELSALHKAAHGLPYPCTLVPVVPLGEKGKQDTITLFSESEEESWGRITVYYEPTFPRPGLYRTFRPESAAFGERGITTSWTYLIGPDRKIIAVRAPGQDGQLYDWLQRNLPESIAPTAKAPSSDVSLPAPDPWSWPVFRRNVRREAKAGKMPDTLPFTYVAWQHRVGATFASPAVADGRAYVATDSRGFDVLSLDDGESLRSCHVGNSWWTSPAIAGDYVYTISSAGTVIALDKLKLTRQWEQRLEGLVTSSPVVRDGALFVGSRNGAVYALDAANGDILWKFQTGGEVSSSPALADGLIIIGSGDRNLYALEAATGRQKWSTSTAGAVDSSPTVADDDVFVGSFDGCLYSIRLADGEINWRCDLGGWVHSSPAVDGDTVFVGTADIRRDETPTFNWVDRESGDIKGRFEMPDRVYSSPTIWDDLVLVGCKDGRLYAFDREMKQTQPVWTFKTRGYVHSSPVVVGDTVLVASYDGNLYALRQSKPIRVWKDKDVVPRWFMAALAKQLHQEVAELIARAAAGEVGAELKLTEFDALLTQIRAQVAEPGAAPKVLPRDVPSDHPGAPYIEYVLTAGLLGGYPDGTFRPSQPTTRYQFSSALSAVLDWVTRPDYVWRVLKERNITGVQVEVRAEPIAGRPPIRLTDVPSGHWARKALAQQAARNILPMGPEGRFGGEKAVTLKDAREQWDLIAQSVRVAREK